MPPESLLPPLLPAGSPARDAHVFFLVRHAQSEANAGGDNEQDTDSPLTALGQQQAQRLAEAFRGAQVGTIVSSDSLRARDTVAPLAAMLGKPVLLREQLREPRGNRKITQFADAKEAAALLELLRSGKLPPPAPPAETHAEVVTRLRSLLDEVRTLAAVGPVVLCSHYVTLNVLVRLLIDAGEPPAALWAHFDNGGVTRVDVPSGRLPPVGIIQFLNWSPSSFTG
jgi:2,3-bisphosphoglycerate-dependent phosphoglycerate mutase